MWKKCLVALITLCAVFGVVFTYANYNIQLQADSASTLGADGPLTARVNKSPSNISDPYVGLQVGDRLLTSNDYPWQLIKSDSYTDYGCGTEYNGTPCDNKQITAWFSWGDKSLGTTKVTDNGAVPPGNDTTYPTYKDTMLYPYIATLNKELTGSDLDLITFRNLTYYHSLVNADAAAKKVVEQTFPSEERGQGAFLISKLEVASLASTKSLGLSFAEKARGLGNLATTYMQGARLTSIPSAGGNLYTLGFNSAFVVIPSAYIDTSNVVFAVEPLQAGAAGLSKTTHPLYSGGNIVNATGNAMKARIHDDALSLTFTDIVDADGDSTTEAKENDKVQFKASAVASGRDITQYRISALIYNEGGQLIYYTTVAGAKAEADSLYDFDTTGLQKGKYFISLVLENGNPSESAPSYASYLTVAKELNIVDSIVKPKIIYTAHYEGKPEVANTYEYSINVKADDKVGDFTLVDVVYPVTLSIVQSPDAPVGNENDFENFMLSQTTLSADASTNVLVSKTAPKLINGSLKAGTYYFMIKAVDDNSKTATYKVELEVKRTKPTLEFEKKVQTDIAIGSSTITEKIKSGNADLSSSVTPTYAFSPLTTRTNLEATVNASDFKSFDLNIGSASTITLPKTYTLTVTTPQTDNYQEMSATKDVRVYNGLEDLTWTPSKTPTYAVSDVKKGNTVGNLEVTGGIGPYTYSFVDASDGVHYDATKGADNAKFTIDQAAIASGKKPVKAGSDLDAGEYHVQFKVADSLGNTSYIDATIKVIASQTLTWSGDNVTKTGTNTWELSTYWSGGSDTYNIQELLNGSTLSEKLGIATDVKNANTSIPFALSLTTNAVDASVISLSTTSPNVLTIKGKPAGAVYITANRGEDGNYSAATPAILNIKVKDLPKLKFEYDTANGCSSSMAASSTCTLANKKLGTISTNPVVSGFTYSIKNIEYDSSGKDTSYVDATGTFRIDNQNEVMLVSDLANGIYKITLSGKNANYTLDDIVVKVTISNNAFNISSWTWEAGNVAALQAISGSMDASTNEYSGVYQREYAPAKSVVKDNFEVALKGTPNGATITYALRSASASNVISHDTAAIFQVEGAGGKNGNANTVFVEATVSMSGYSDVSVYLPIVITKYPQKIEFADNNPIYLPNNGVCTTIPTATVSSTFSNYVNPGNPIEYKADASSSGAITVNGNQICSIAGTSSTSAKVNAELDGDTNYEKATASKNVILYAPGSITVTQSIQSIAGGASNITYTPGTHLVAHDSTQSKNGTANKDDVAAKVKLTGMVGSASYKMSTNTNAANENKGYFEVHPTSGDITLKQDITASNLFAHQGNIFYIQVDVTDPHGFVQTVDVQIVIDDAIAEFYFHNGGTKLPITGAGSGMYLDNLTGVAKYIETYAKNGTITRIETNRGDATYSVDDHPSADSEVIGFVSGNTYRILNATDEQATYGGEGGKAYAKACIAAGSGYQAQCIYAEVEIKKADQTGFAFAQDPLNLASTSGAVTPLYKNHLDGQDVFISNSSDPSIVDAGTYVAGSDQELQVFKEGGPVTITATTEGNRNYNSATATTTVNVSTKPPTTLTVDVNPKPIYYGDTGTHAKINVGYKSGVPAYFSSSDPSIVEVNDSSTGDNTSDFLIIKGIGTVDIEVCQTNKAGFTAGDACPADGDYGYKTITVLPREITLKFRDEVIYVGEDLPTYVFEDNPVNGTFAGSDAITDFMVPANANAMDGTSILSDSTKKGIYPIQGSYSSTEKLDSFLKNYKITIQDGSLEIKQDPSDISWFYLEGVTTGNQPLDPAQWYKEDIYVKLDPVSASGSAGSYNEISDTTLFTNADKTKYFVSNEDDNTKDVYFRIDPNGGAVHAGVISEKQSTSVKIDKTAPSVTGAKGTPSTNNLLEDLINVISFNTFFKPGVEIILSSEDPQPQGSTKVVSVSGVSSVDYTVYEVDETTGVVDATKAPITGNGTVDANGDIKFNIPNVGAYKVCAIAHDNAGNDSTEACYYVNVKNLNVDIDGDGTDDFVDIDNNGCPDLNILLGEDKNGNPVKMNVAEKGKSYPYMNIDANGDGKPDLNIDTDHDGKPDLNLVDLAKETPQGGLSAWEPTYCVIVDKLKDYSKPIEYCTGTKATAQINVDTDGDGIPNINIDTDGDMKADINIDTDKDGKPNTNIVKHTTWNPNKDFTVDDFLYDTEVLMPQYNIDSNGDGYPDINVDIDGDGIPDINIDTDGDFSKPETNIDTTGDGKPDTNLDPKGTGIPEKNIVNIDAWNPTKIVQGDEVTYGTMEIPSKDELGDQGIIIKPSDPNDKFLPNFALKVDEITDTIEDKEKEEIKKNMDNEDGEVKTVYDVQLLEDNKVVQPNGKVEVHVPVDDTVRNPKIMMQDKDGTWKEVQGKLDNGKFTFETDYIGKISVVGDKEDTVNPDPNPKPDDDANGKPDDNTNADPDGKGDGDTSDGDTDNTPSVKDPSVQGNYTTQGGTAQGSTTNGMGGANTGDDTQNLLYLFGCLGALICIGIECAYKKSGKA